MTLTVMVPPAFLALTTTPSLAEDTCPPSATGACACANWGRAKVATAAAAVMIDQRMRIVASRWGEEIRVLQCTGASPVFRERPRTWIRGRTMSAMGGRRCLRSPAIASVERFDLDDRAAM